MLFPWIFDWWLLPYYLALTSLELCLKILYKFAPNCSPISSNDTYFLHTTYHLTIVSHCHIDTNQRQPV